MAAARERAESLKGKVEKLRRLAEGATGPESQLAKAKADELEKELEAIEAEMPKRGRAAKPKPAKAPKPPPPFICGYDEEPIAKCDVLSPYSHRHFQIAEHAARWTGILVHLDRKWLAPYAVFYGPEKYREKARSRYERLRRTFDARLEKWIDSQEIEPTESECDRYAHGFLQGLDEREREKETPEARQEREMRLRRCDMAYERGEGR
jgi:hypothetical protein